MHPLPGAPHDRGLQLPSRSVCHLPAPPAEYSPFYGIEKGAVLQEARIFHDPNLDPRRCSQASRGRAAMAPLLRPRTALLAPAAQTEPDLLKRGQGAAAVQQTHNC